MGLDITVYRGLIRDTNPDLDEDGNPHNGFLAHPSTFDFTEENWPGRTEGIERGAVYSFADSFGFRAGSYGGYNHFRRWLCRLAGFADDCAAWAAEQTEYPFRELINFADNEGFIGPIVAANLAKDFADNEARAITASEAMTDDGPYYLEKYREWLKAFEMAADGGAVEFH